MVEQPALLAGTREHGARLSDDGRYRWSLWRHWDRTSAPLGWIMLNPSTADANVDDATIRRCIGFARRDGYGGIRVANLYGLRATNPAALLDTDDPVGRQGGARYDPWAQLIFACTDIVCAWGAVPKACRQRVAEVLADHPWPRLFCLGTTAGGHPRHPLYVPAARRLVRWNPEQGAEHP